MRLLALLVLTACTSEAQQALDDARALWEAEGASSYTYTADSVQCSMFCDPGRWEVVVTDDEVSLRREIQDGSTPAGVLQGIPRAFDHIQGILDGPAVDEEITLDGVGGLHMSFWHCEGCDDSGAILSLTGYTPWTDSAGKRPPSSGRVSLRRGGKMLSLAVAWAAEAPVEARQVVEARSTLEAGLVFAAVGGALVGGGVALEDERIGCTGFTTGVVGTLLVFGAKVRIRDLHRNHRGLRLDVLQSTRGAFAASFGLVTLGGGLGLLAGAAGSWGVDAGVKLIVGTPVTATGLLLTIVGGQAWVRNRDGVVDWSLEPVWTPQLRGIRLQRRW